MVGVWPHGFAERFPRLAASVPRVSLGVFPTPVERAEALGRALNAALWIKRDDLSGTDYGGNKVRKLEFYLAAAQAEGRSEVLTIGPAGSNHVAATGWYARRLGLACSAASFPQPNAEYVRRNLRFDLANGVRLLPSLHPGTMPLTAARAWLTRRWEGSAIRYIPPGGSSPPGCLGFVLAAFELAGQIAEGLVPRPRSIYLPLGTGGTAAGLILGLRLLGLESIAVRPVLVVPSPFAGAGWVAHHANRCARWLHAIDPDFPPLRLRAGAVAAVTDQLGGGYAHFTEAGMEARRLMADTQGIPLEGTYSAKALAALIADRRAGRLGADDPVLFWDTANSRDLSALIADADCRKLPARLQRYFDRPPQPLDAPLPHRP